MQVVAGKHDGSESKEWKVISLISEMRRWTGPETKSMKYHQSSKRSGKLQTRRAVKKLREKEIICDYAEHPSLSTTRCASLSIIFPLTIFVFHQSPGARLWRKCLSRVRVQQYIST